MKQWKAVACAWGLWLAACGGTSKEDFTQERDDALCHRQARCGEIHDEDACASGRREWSEALRERGMEPYAIYEGSLEAGRTRFDEERAEACADLLRESSCEQSLEEVTSAEVCRVLVGQRQDGEACLINEDCGAASFCSVELRRAVCEAGTCKPLPGVGERLLGYDNVYSCAPGLSPDANSICQPTVGENGPCQSTLSCAVGLVCDPNSQQCQRRGRVGERCGEGAPSCLTHLRCAEGSCRELAGVGESCTLSRTWGTSWSSDCKRDLFCDAALDTTQGTCKLRREEGSECRDYSECAPVLFCDQRPGQQARTCQKGVGEGGTCDNAVCEPGLVCHPDTSTCVRRGKAGEACAMSNGPLSVTCQEGLTCHEGTCKVSYPGLCGAP
jgi:hypothetical protein